MMAEDRDKTLPERVEVTSRFISDTAAKQRAYEARRRMWTAAFHPSEPRAQALAVSRRRGKIHDQRQGKFDL
jgi:GMP synthase-like glutamine amidotransferase